jgi:hypothetical protein
MRSPEILPSGGRNPSGRRAARRPQDRPFAYLRVQGQAAVAVSAPNNERRAHGVGSESRPRRRLIPTTIRQPRHSGCCDWVGAAQGMLGRSTTQYVNQASGDQFPLRTIKCARELCLRVTPHALYGAAPDTNQARDLHEAVAAIMPGGASRKTYRAAIFPSRTIMTSIPV